MHLWNFPSPLGMIWSLALPPCRTPLPEFAQKSLSRHEKLFLKSLPYFRAGDIMESDQYMGSDCERSNGNYIQKAYVINGDG